MTLVLLSYLNCSWLGFIEDSLLLETTGTHPDVPLYVTELFMKSENIHIPVVSIIQT
jgi:hypothetical protein